MAGKKNAAAAAPGAEGTVNNGEAGAEVKPSKPKKERLFKASAIDLSDQKKQEKSVTGKFNRAGRAIKGLGLPDEATTAILATLQTTFDEAIKKIYSTIPVGATAPAASAAEMV